MVKLAIEGKKTAANHIYIFIKETLQALLCIRRAQALLFEYKKII